MELNKTEKFIIKSKKVHGGLYDYSETNYIDAQTEVCIICPKHGKFWQKPSKHLSGHGCLVCGEIKKQQGNINNNLKAKASFIEKSNKIHNDLYDYTDVNYINALTKVKIKCKRCGHEFEQTPNKHLQGRGCPICAAKDRGLKHRTSTEDYIKKVSKIHNNFYDYSKLQYETHNKEVCVICPIHGEFWILASKHLYDKQGCPKCTQSSLERTVDIFLTNKTIKYTSQKSFDWLYNKKFLHLDFYLPEYNIAIECQGIQHFKPIDIFGGEEGFKNTQIRDKIKYDLCKEHGIKILYFSNLNQYDNF